MMAHPFFFLLALLLLYIHPLHLIMMVALKTVLKFIKWLLY
jgi:hypothetical protein